MCPERTEEHLTPNGHQVRAGQVLAERRSCTNLRHTGQFCEASVDEDSPVTLCPEHLQRAYRHVRDDLREWFRYSDDLRRHVAMLVDHFAHAG